MIRRPPRSTLDRSSAASDVYKRQVRDLEREHIPLCQRFGLGVLPWSPLAGGFLAGKYGKDLSLIHISEPTRPY